MVTISTHNGSSAHRDHNIRNEKVVSKEEHIQEGGHYEIWKDETPRQAYHKLFDKAVERYNEKQTREDRKIKNYYSQIEKDEKKHPVYEMIIGVYPSGGEQVSEETQRLILKEFVDSWQVRNPNLYLCGAYFHNDEQGEPHCHIDYIPVAHGYSKGMDTQTGLVKALGEQGIEKQGRLTAQIQWEKKQNEYLESLCKARGLEVAHPKEEGRVHLDTETYKAEQTVKTLKNEIEELETIKKMDESIVKEKDAQISNIEAYIGSIEEKSNKYTDTLKEVQEELNIKQSIVNTLNDALANLFTRFNKAYIQMQKIFDHWNQEDLKIYKELVAKADKPIQQGNEAMKTLLNKSDIIFGKATKEALAQVKEESSKLQEATEELEELEEDYDYE